MRQHMKHFLNQIRSPEGSLPVNRRVRNTIAILCLGIALGTFSKLLDTTPVDRLPDVFACLDIRNFLGRFAVWALLALCISVYSSSSLRAGVNVFVFFTGMVGSYYLYSYYIGGFFPKSYAMIWFCFTAVSPLPALVCWYAKGRSRLGFLLSVSLLAVLFNMTFVYGRWYLEARSIPELAVFLIGFLILKRDTLKGSVLMGVFGIALGFLLDIVVPFHFG